MLLIREKLFSEFKGAEDLNKVGRVFKLYTRVNISKVAKLLKINEE